MKAVSLDAFGDATHFKLVQLPIPKPKNGEVRIRIKASGFNPVDAKIRTGQFGGNLPVILGADCSGIIDEVASDIKEFALGDEVLALVFGQGSNGTNAEYVCISADFVARKPKNLSFEQGACVPLAALTAYRAVISTGAVKKGTSVFISSGSGGVGMIAIQLASMVGAGPIFSLAGSEESLHLLIHDLKLKKEHILFYKSLSFEERKQKLIEMNEGKFFPSVFDFTGGDMKHLCFALVDYQGHVISIVPEKPDFSLELWKRGASIAFEKNLNLHFVFVGAEAFQNRSTYWKVYAQQLNQISQWIESGQLRIPVPKVFDSLSVENIKAAHQQYDQGMSSGKMVFKVS